MTKLRAHATVLCPDGGKGPPFVTVLSSSSVFYVVKPRFHGDVSGLSGPYVPSRYLAYRTINTEAEKALKSVGPVLSSKILWVWDSSRGPYLGTLANPLAANIQNRGPQGAPKSLSLPLSRHRSPFRFALATASLYTGVPRITPSTGGITALKRGAFERTLLPSQTLP